VDFSSKIDEKIGQSIRKSELFKINKLVQKSGLADLNFMK